MYDENKLNELINNYNSERGPLQLSEIIDYVTSLDSDDYVAAKQKVWREIESYSDKYIIDNMIDSRKEVLENMIDSRKEVLENIKSINTELDAIKNDKEHGFGYAFSGEDQAIDTLIEVYHNIEDLEGKITENEMAELRQNFKDVEEALGIDISTTLDNEKEIDKLYEAVKDSISRNLEITTAVDNSPKSCLDNVEAEIRGLLEDGESQTTIETFENMWKEVQEVVSLMDIAFRLSDEKLLDFVDDYANKLVEDERIREVLLDISRRCKEAIKAKKNEDSMSDDSETKENDIEVPPLGIDKPDDKDDSDDNEANDSEDDNDETKDEDEIDDEVNTKDDDIDNPDDNPDNEEEELEEEQEKTIPVIIKHKDPKLTWKTAAMVAAGVGIGAGVFFAAGPGGAIAVGVAGFIAKKIIRKKRKALAEQRIKDIENGVEVEEAAPPEGKISKALYNLHQYLHSDEGLRDLEWLCSAASISGATAGIGGGVFNIVDFTAIPTAWAIPSGIAAGAIGGAADHYLVRRGGICTEVKVKEGMTPEEIAEKYGVDVDQVIIQEREGLTR